MATRHEMEEFSHRIGGIEECTLLDYPNRVAAILFYKGCNLRCPYCYNVPLVTEIKETSYLAQDVINFLMSRKGKLEGIVFSGGECTVWGEKLIDDIRFVRSLHYLVKVDTNGTNPDIIKKLVNNKWVDYIAMDVKCDKKNSDKFGFGAKYDLSMETLQFLIQSGIQFETRTTIHPDVMNEEEISNMMKELSDIGLKGRHYLQYYFQTDNTVDKKLNHSPRKIDASKIDMHGINVVFRNQEQNDRRI